jgi:hypothetical protein
MPIDEGPIKGYNNSRINTNGLGQKTYYEAVMKT